MKKTIGFSLLILAAVFIVNTSAAYETENYKWPDSEGDPFVIVQIKDDIPDNWITPILNAGNRWNDVEPNFDYTFTPSNSENYVTVGPVDGSGSVVARATVSVWGDLDPSTIENGYITFDETEDFSTDDDSSTFNVEAIATHEFGHLLGLAHTNADYDSLLDAPTMISGAPPCCEEPLRTLEQDDIDGINSIY